MHTPKSAWKQRRAVQELSGGGETPGVKKAKHEALRVQCKWGLGQRPKVNSETRLWSTVQPGETEPGGIVMIAAVTQRKVLHAQFHRPTWRRR